MTMRDSARLAIENHFFRVYSFPVRSDLHLGMPGEGKQDMQTGRRGAFLPLLELFGPIFGMNILQGSYRIKQVNRLRKKKLIDITFHRMERRSHFHCQSFGFLQTGRSKVHSRYSKALSGQNVFSFSS